MWTRQMLGTDLYHLVSSFIIYSMLGWLVESIYMSICNRKVVNRGFGKGPFCPIYGFGAVIGYLLLHPLKKNWIGLYIVGSLLATIFEFLVGKCMMKLLGAVWWDYNDKPYNYKGIICLESTIAWGFYAMIIVLFLHNRVNRFIDSYNYRFGICLITVCLLAVMVDYMIQLYKIFEDPVKEKKEKLVERYQSFKARWY